MAITSRRNPLVARYRAAARGESDDVLLLDGVHLIAEALRSGAAVRHAAVTHGAQGQPDVQKVIAALARADVDVDMVAPAVIDAISPVKTPTGIVALADRPVGGLSRLFAGAAPLLIVAVGIQDPGNIGAIVRVAEAGGASGVVASDGSADPFGWKALRGSMGSALRLPLAATSTGEAIAAARGHGCRIIATVARDGRTLYDTDLRGPIAILIGGEGHGLDASVIAAADERVTIPMQAPVESLNAATAAALIVYEARRQRT